MDPILVTGGTGTLGRHVVRRLNSAGHHIRVFTRQPRHDEKRVSFARGNLLSGIGLDAAKWVVEKDLALTGADTWAVEVVPNPDKTLAFAVHMTLQTKHGILNHENLFFDDLIADKKYQFVYSFTPVPIVGGTGSPGVPIGIT